jgi:hypothetical protein
MNRKVVDQSAITEIGLLADLCDNMLAGSVLPVLPAIHIEAMTGKYREARDRLRALYVKLSGENPWE